MSHYYQHEQAPDTFCKPRCSACRITKLEEALSECRDFMVERAHWQENDREDVVKLARRCSKLLQDELEGEEDDETDEM